MKRHDIYNSRYCPHQSENERIADTVACSVVFLFNRCDILEGVKCLCWIKPYVSFVITDLTFIVTFAILIMFKQGKHVHLF